MGINAENGHKLLLTVGFILVTFALSYGIRAVLRVAERHGGSESAKFWARQIVSLGTACIVLLGLLSIGLDNPARLTTAMGLATAGLAWRCKN